METLIQKYKEIKAEIENLEEALNGIRSNILQECGHQEYEGYGLKITLVTPEPGFDWKTAVAVWQIKDEQLKPFFKDRPGYLKFTIKRTIDK